MKKGFTLVEVLLGLFLCTCLTVSVAAAVAGSVRATALAEKHRDVVPLLETLYTTYRLDAKAAPPEMPPGWAGMAMDVALPMPVGEDSRAGLEVQLRPLDAAVAHAFLYVYDFPALEETE